MRLVRMLTLLTALLLLGCGTALAWDLNKDFWNTTGQVVNDIEIILDGTQVITDHYDGDAGMQWPSFVVSYETIGGVPKTVLRWSGMVVAPGAKIHVGYSTAAGGPCQGIRWTRDGVPVGPVAQLDLAQATPGVAITVGNTLTLSLWPVSWPIVPDPIYVGAVTVYYFSSFLPLSNLNNTLLPTWTPLRVNTLRAGMLPALAIAPGAWTTFTDPNRPSGAVSAVWVMDVNTTPSTVQASRDFVQYDISGPTRAQGSSWGRIKSLYR